MFLFSFACTGLCCLAGFFSSCEESGCPLAVLHGILTVEASLHGALSGADSAVVTTGFSALCYMESSPAKNPAMSPALAGGLLPTVPPEKF